MSEKTVTSCPASPSVTPSSCEITGRTPATTKASVPSANIPRANKKIRQSRRRVGIDGETAFACSVFIKSFLSFIALFRAYYEDRLHVQYHCWTHSYRM